MEKSDKQKIGLVAVSVASGSVALYELITLSNGMSPMLHFMGAVSAIVYLWLTREVTRPLKPKKSLKPDVAKAI